MKRISAIIRLMLLMQCFGLAFIFYFKGSKIGNYLFLEQSWIETSSRYLDYILIGSLIVLAFINILKPRFSFLLVLFSIFLSEAYFTYILGGSVGSEGALFGQFARYSWPLILAFSISKRRSFPLVDRHSCFIFQIAIGITFMTHGWEAWRLAPRFIDYLVLAFNKFFAINLLESQAQLLLRGIGLADIMLGIWVIIRPNLGILTYMGIWGFVTAYMRVVFSGWVGVPDFMIRSAHWIVPIIIAIALSSPVVTKKRAIRGKIEPVA